MDADAWEQVKSILAEALEVPPDERQAYVASHYAHLGLKTEVEAFLRHYDDDFLRTVVTVGAAPSTPTGDDDFDVPAGTRIGRYIVLDRLGEGGMGKVYLAT